LDDFLSLLAPILCQCFQDDVCPGVIIFMIFSHHKKDKGADQMEHDDEKDGAMIVYFMLSLMALFLGFVLIFIFINQFDSFLTMSLDDSLSF
jgi:hypothetical protein